MKSKNVISITSTSSDITPSYILRPATMDDALEIWTVMDECYQTLPSKDLFICDDLKYVKEILSSHGFGIVACDNHGKIVGNLLLKYPGLTAENLGHDVFQPICNAFENPAESMEPCNIPLTSENLNRVLHMDSASVLPCHRGHGLEERMIAYAETLIDTSKYRYAFATVSPDNIASLKSLKKNGYEVMVTKEKYGNLKRCIMLKILS